MSSHAQQARTLVEALPYIQKFTGKTIVVKYGGNAMVSDELRRAVMCDIILLSLVGIRVVVVHGGGPEISAMLKKLGKESRFVDGLRCTDAETMDVVQSVLCGKVNKNLVAQLNRLGGQAIGLCGMDGQLFQAEQLDEKYGLVGKITGVNPEPVENALLSGYIPVVSTVAQGVDADTAYNINADTAASKLAAAMGAEKLILLTDVRGLLRDPKDEDTLIPEVGLSQVPGLVKDGVIQGGMIPKVDCCVEAVRSGANPDLTTRQKHMRECFVVAEEGADRARIEQAIITMPHYFADYDTTVHFLSEEELLRDHGGLPHGGFVFRGGRTGRQEQNRALLEFRLTLDSNPEFTACVLTAFARAAFRLGRAGQAGCKTVFDIPPAALSSLSPEELRRQLL